MLDLQLPPMQAPDLVLVQDEPALEIALPQTFTQPELTAIQQGRLSNTEALIAKIHNLHRDHPSAGLGADYQALVKEFQPLFSWAMASWDFLLSTEGCRFVPRNQERKIGIRGDYRAFTDKDFSRLIHRIFRQSILDFAEQPHLPNFAEWLRDSFWSMTLKAYQLLEKPPDPRQRLLTPYSYLRCTPYEFLNDYHQDLVYSIVKQLPESELKAIDTYFLNFYTESATAESLQCSTETALELLRLGLTKLLIRNRLAYCLLRQIERY